METHVMRVPLTPTMPDIPDAWLEMELIQKAEGRSEVLLRARVVREPDRVLSETYMEAPDDFLLHNGEQFLSFVLGQLHVGCYAAPRKEVMPDGPQQHGTAGVHVKGAPSEPQRCREIASFERCCIKSLGHDGHHVYHAATSPPEVSPDGQAAHDALEVLCRVFDDGADVAFEEWSEWYKPEEWLGSARALGAFIRKRLDKKKSDGRKPQPVTRAELEEAIEARVNVAVTASGGWPTSGLETANKLTALLDRLYASQLGIELGVFYTDPKGARIERARRLCDAYHFALIWRAEDSPERRATLNTMQPPPGAGDLWFWQRVVEELETYKWSPEAAPPC